jgi:2-phospho-L-lactate/phosphoenolpyruvate guanylyltransferase
MTGPWVVVVAQKRLDVAKSRLQLAGLARESVARAMFQDTVLAARGASLVHAIVVVADRGCDSQLVQATDVVPLVRQLPDLNAALRAGAELGRAGFLGCHVAAMTADLPGLRSSELDQALQEAARHERSFVADRHRRGTTLLTARAGAELEPRFGPGSRHAHQLSGAHEISDGELDSLRHDVDDLHDLTDLVATLTPGPHLRATLDALGPDTTKETA